MESLILIKSETMQRSENIYDSKKRYNRSERDDGTYTSETEIASHDSKLMRTVGQTGIAW